MSRRSVVLEKSIEADLIDALRTMGFRVTKTSQPRPSMITRGVPDLYAVRQSDPSGWPALRLWIEVKRPGGALSDHQRAWHTAGRSAGGTVLVIRSVSELVQELKRMGAPIT